MSHIGTHDTHLLFQNVPEVPIGVFTHYVYHEDIKK